MQIAYAAVMVIPLLLLADVLVTFRRKRYLRRRKLHLTAIQILRTTALALIWILAVAIILLVIFPSAFGSTLAAVILFQPDVGWVALLSGIFAILWGILRTGLFLWRTKA
jgi:hypothetical protein